MLCFLKSNFQLNFYVKQIKKKILFKHFIKYFTFLKKMLGIFQNIQKTFCNSPLNEIMYDGFQLKTLKCKLKKFLKK